jgi:DNA methyltransferase 1-associated protein 1
MLGLPIGEVAPPLASKKSKKGGQTKRIRTS